MSSSQTRDSGGMWTLETSDPDPDSQNPQDGGGGPGHSESGRHLREGFLIAALPVVAFAFAFAYEADYGRYFHIPLGLIRLSWTTVLIAAGGVFLLGFLLLHVVQLVYATLGDRSRSRRTLLVSTYVILTIAYLVLFGLRWREYVWFLATAALFLAVEYLLPLVTQRDKHPYREKLRAQDALEAKAPSLLGRFVERVGRETFLLLVGGLLALFLTFHAGRANAIKRVNFPIIVNQSTELVILRFYEDIAIAAGYDREQSRISARIEVLAVRSDSQPLGFQIEEVGPLIPVPLASSD